MLKVKINWEGINLGVSHNSMDKVTEYDADIKLALKSVKLALATCLNYLCSKSSQVKKLMKDDGSPVTSMDFAIQTIISKVIWNSQPGSVIIGEERALDIADTPEIRSDLIDIVSLAFPDLAENGDIDSVSLKTAPLNRKQHTHACSYFCKSHL